MQTTSVQHYECLDSALIAVFYVYCSTLLQHLHFRMTRGILSTALYSQCLITINKY